MPPLYVGSMHVHGGLRAFLVPKCLGRRASSTTGVDCKILDFEPDDQVYRLRGAWCEYILHVGGTCITVFEGRLWWIIYC